MPVWINWATRVITVPVDFLAHISGPVGAGGLFELDVNALRIALKDIEDDEGMPYPDTHSHSTSITLSGVTYSRTFAIINGYTLAFDDTVLNHYTVRCAGANHNIADVKVLNTVSMIVGNSAGLITVVSGSGLSTEQATQLLELYRRLGLELGTPVVVTPDTLVAGNIEQAITETGATRTVERQ